MSDKFDKQALKNIACKNLSQESKSDEDDDIVLLKHFTAESVKSRVGDVPAAKTSSIPRRNGDAQTSNKSSARSIPAAAALNAKAIKNRAIANLRSETFASPVNRGHRRSSVGTDGEGSSSPQASTSKSPCAAEALTSPDEDSDSEIEILEEKNTSSSSVISSHSSSNPSPRNNIRMDNATPSTSQSYQLPRRTIKRITSIKKHVKLPKLQNPLPTTITTPHPVPVSVIQHPSNTVNNPSVVQINNIVAPSTPVTKSTSLTYPILNNDLTSLHLPAFTPPPISNTLTDPQPSTSSGIFSPLTLTPRSTQGVKRKLHDDMESTTPSVSTTPMKLAVFTPETSPESISKYAYLEAFKHFLIEVWGCPPNSLVFDSQDLKTFMLFKELKPEAQALYLQLFKMKHQWRRVNEIKYDDIDPNLIPWIKELNVQQFLLGPEELTDLESMLDLFKANEIKQLMNEFKIPAKGRKANLIKALIAHAQSQRSIFASTSKGSSPGKNGHNLVSVLTGRVKDTLGSCVKINPCHADALHRTCLLGSLDNCLREDISQLIFKIFSVQNKNIIFAPFQRIRRQAIFPDKPALEKFQKAQKMFTEAAKLSEARQHQPLVELSETANTEFNQILQDNAMSIHISQLPKYLRRYSAGEVLISVMEMGMTAMGRLKKYLPYVQTLRMLLDQELYKTRSRGMWYEQLALMYHVHLKNYDKTAEVIMEAIDDPAVHVINRLGIAFRAQQILQRKDWKPRADIDIALKNFIQMVRNEVKEVKEVQIRGRTSLSQSPGFKMNFIIDSGIPGAYTVCSVEELAIWHYTNKAEFTHGKHTEGAIVESLFGIIFWDILYEHVIPDTFLTPYQKYPADLYSTDFYLHRKEVIDQRISNMKSWSDAECCAAIEIKWNQHFNKTSIVSWGIFKNKEEAQDILVCIGPLVMAGICHRLCKEYRIARSGFPDIVVWNRMARKCKFVEVKSPSDTLSNRQKIWLHYLNELSADAEVCKVQAVSSKFLNTLEQEEFAGRNISNPVPSTSGVEM